MASGRREKKPRFPTRMSVDGRSHWPTWRKELLGLQPCTQMLMLDCFHCFVMLNKSVNCLNVLFS